ncbi:hypothetical protein HNP10_002168 [Aeromonas veronii]|uniref:DUF2256 domain-containing protein n=1 Tax=Aeromonas veronii TaxID=654 RepID=UPI0016197AE0|nr:DUF2256 domain-containing protein [Aeromonas veronii]MCS3833407.1 hypothetical protein [Aeromonas veronii]
MQRKPHLPEKICPVCQRPFSWRRKWARSWEEVRYCSERCRHARHSRQQPEEDPA